jgi:hypothetical protein
MVASERLGLFVALAHTRRCWDDDVDAKRQGTGAVSIRTHLEHAE